LFVTLKIPDAEAATAENTLRRYLGYEKELKGLRRESLWSVLVDAADESEAEGMGRQFAERQLVNDNKESYRIEVGEEELQFGESEVPRLLTRLKIKDGVAVTVRDTLRQRLGFGERVVEVKRGSLWFMDAEPKLVEKIAVDLLVNKNKDEFFVL